MAASAPTKRQVTRDVIVSLAVNGIGPLLTYILLSPHMADVNALLIASLFPVLDNLYTIARHRRLDVFGVFILVGLLLSILLLLVSGNARLILIRESLLTGVIGLVMLASLLMPRPLLFYFASHFTAGHDAAKQAEFNNNWKVAPYFRFVMRLMTIVWGVTLVLEAIIRTALVYQLSTLTFLAVSPFIQYGFLGFAIVWTVWYARHARRRGAIIRQQRLAVSQQPSR
jgi:hypothetical protein